jgi:hypothetical protein
LLVDDRFDSFVVGVIPGFGETVSRGKRILLSYERDDVIERKRRGSVCDLYYLPHVYTLRRRAKDRFRS